MWAAVGRERQTDLDTVEPDLASERDFRDIAALAEIPVGHADTDRQRRGRRLRLPSRDGREHRCRHSSGPDEITPRHFHGASLPLVITRLRRVLHKSWTRRRRTCYLQPSPVSAAGFPFARTVFMHLKSAAAALVLSLGLASI